jgi:hypothetical protein
MERSRAELLAAGQPLSQCFIAAGKYRQPFEEPSKIETRTPYYQWQMAPRGDSGDDLSGGASIITGRETHCGVQDV